LLETHANPTLIMTDIRKVCEAVAALKIAKGEARPLVMVDNTMLGPAFQHPLSLGADLVMYSGTKYLSGLSDMLAGIVLAKDASLIKKIAPKRSLFGTILQPDECWMLTGRLPTVELRMTRQPKNEPRLLPDALHRPGAEENLQRPVRSSRRDVFTRTQGRQDRRIRLPSPS
jgi:methionine-gamma-lyase